jgi:hypothetical protein
VIQIDQECHYVSEFVIGEYPGVGRHEGFAKLDSEVLNVALLE